MTKFNLSDWIREKDGPRLPKPEEDWLLTENVQEYIEYVRNDISELYGRDYEFTPKLIYRDELYRIINNRAGRKFAK